jgi:hypothetical protein
MFRRHRCGGRNRKRRARESRYADTEPNQPKAETPVPALFRNTWLARHALVNRNRTMLGAPVQISR